MSGKEPRGVRVGMGQAEQGGTEVRLSAEFQQTGSSEDVLVLVFGLLCVCVCEFVCLFEKG